MKVFLSIALFCLISTPALSEQTDQMALRNCEICGDYPWIVTKPSGKKFAEELVANSDTMVFKEKERIIVRLKHYDRSLPQDKVIEAALKGQATISTKQLYRPDGLLPKKVITDSLAILQNESVVIGKEEKSVFPWELLTLFLSSITFGLAWIFMKREESERLPYPGYWMLVFTIASAYLCGVSIFGLFSKDEPDVKVFLSFTIGGLMFGFITLIAYSAILFLSMIMTEGLSRLLKKKSDKYEALDDWFPASATLCLIMALSGLSLAIPLASSAKNIPSAVFTIFLPGVGVALIGQFIFDAVLKTRKNDSDL
jgi:hypothetical protein